MMETNEFLSKVSEQTLAVLIETEIIAEKIRQSKKRGCCPSDIDFTPAEVARIREKAEHEFENMKNDTGKVAAHVEGMLQSVVYPDK